MWRPRPRSRRITRPPEVVPTMLALVPVIVVGWWAVRLLVGAWVRAQPPDPLDR
jgi:hypothetical protein